MCVRLRSRLRIWTAGPSCDSMWAFGAMDELNKYEGERIVGRSGLSTLAMMTLLGGLVAAGPASAVTINDLFVFGDSYSDTGAFFPLTNGSTAVGYLAKDFGITLTTSKNPDPHTDGVNFAESGARVFVGPTPPATQPRSLTQQVAEFQNYAESGKISFQPETSLFFLLGG